VDFQARYGRQTWAVVTGATDGIGLQLAKDLAAKGFNIVVVGRNAEKAERAAAQIQNAYSVKTRIVLKDLAQCTSQEDFADFERLFLDLDVSILVNNAGMSVHGQLTQLSFTDVAAQLNLNCLQLTWLCHIAQRTFSMRAHQSLVINVSSFFGKVHSP